jgi:hypothetical protein
MNQITEPSEQVVWILQLKTGTFCVIERRFVSIKIPSQSSLHLESML